MGFEHETCCSSGASTTTAQLRRLVMEADRVGIYPFNLWVVFILLIYGCQHAIGPVLWDAYRVGIYPFNLELKFVTGISPSYLI